MPKKRISKTISQKSSFRDRIGKQRFQIPDATPKNITLLVLLLIVLGLLAFFYRNKGLFVAATVNGEPITRIAVVKQLEQQGGKQVLNDLITQTIVMQEAKKKGLTVSRDEVSAQIAKLNDNLKKQGQSLDELLTAQSLSRQDLEQRIKLQTIIDKMFGNSISVSDKEIDDYIAANKDQIPANTDMNQYRQTVKDQLRQQKLKNKVTSWLQDLQKKAKINYYVSY